MAGLVQTNAPSQIDDDIFHDSSLPTRDSPQNNFFATPRVTQDKSAHLVRQTHRAFNSCRQQVGSLRPRYSHPERPTAHVPPSRPPAHQDRPFPNSNGCKRWSSTSNIHQPEETPVHDLTSPFGGLYSDPNSTVDQLREFNEAESLDCYKKIVRHPSPLRKSNSSSNLGDVRRSVNQDEQWVELTPVVDQSHSRRLPKDVIGVPPLRSQDSADADMYHPSAYLHKDPLRSSLDPVFLPSQYPVSSYLLPSAFRSPSIDFTSHALSASYQTRTDTSPFLSSDLTQWQQQHQEQLRRQQLDVAQGTGLFAIKRAADDIIKEKDAIIDKQKYRLQELEKHGRESEVAKQRELLQRTQKERQALAVQLQGPPEKPMESLELQMENATLKSQLVDSTSSIKRLDRQDLEKKLGATEYELQKLRSCMDSELAHKRAEIKQLQDQILEKDSEISSLKDRNTEIGRRVESLQRQLEGQQRYLQDIPTPEEHAKGHAQFKAMSEELQQLKSSKAALEKRLQEALKGCRSRDGLIEAFEKKEKDLREKLKAQERERLKLEKQMNGESLITPDEREELEELRAAKKQLQAKCDRAQKLLEGSHKKLQQLETKQLTREAELQERINHEAATVLAYKEDLDAKEQNLRKLRQSIKEMGKQNQELLDRRLGLEDRIKELEKQFSSESSKLQKRLLQEMDVCFAELHSLVQFCFQQAEGQEPNVSVLLGAKGESDPSMDSAGATTVQALRYKVSKVQDLRREVDKLRELLSNKYAEEMGDRLECTTQ